MQFHFLSKLFKLWKADVDHYYVDKITWNELQANDIKRVVESFWDYAIPIWRLLRICENRVMVWIR